MMDSALGTGKDRWTHPAAVLVATDLSDLDRLMPFAFRLSEETGARLILLHVLATGAIMAVDTAGMPYYDSAAALDNATRAMAPWCDQARQRDVTCDALVREGHAPQQIAIAARQFQADRILLGTRSRSRLGKLLLGSVAEQVLRSVNLPVMTVGPEAHLPAPEHPKVVLHATTLRETSRPSAALACNIAASQSATLVLLHVLPPAEEPHPQASYASSQPADPASSAMKELRALAAETGGNCCAGIEPLVVHGNPPIEILAEASQRHVSLIVLGAAERSVFENLARDRTIYRVLAHARCPVLTLRELPVLPAAEEPQRVATHN